MVLANLYVIGWNYEKWKYVLPFNRLPISDELTEKKKLGNKFPTLFFAGVFAAVVFFMFAFPRFYSVMPHNTLPQCLKQFKDGNRTKASEDFCGCIHKSGKPLDKCLDDYDNAPDDVAETP